MKMMPSMDQRCSSSSSSSPLRPSMLIKPAPPCDFGYPPPEMKFSSPLAYNMVSNSHGFSYSRFGNDTDSSSTAPEIGWDSSYFEGQEKRPYMIRWKSGKKVDQRLLMLLESFYQEIYVKRQDFFKKIFPGRMQNEFEDVFHKIDTMLWKNKNEVRNHTLQRSLSVGSPRRPHRFKVKTPAVVIGNLDGQGGSTNNYQSTYGK